MFCNMEQPMGLILLEVALIRPCHALCGIDFVGLRVFLSKRELTRRQSIYNDLIAHVIW